MRAGADLPCWSGTPATVDDPRFLIGMAGNSASLDFATFPVADSFGELRAKEVSGAWWL